MKFVFLDGKEMAVLSDYDGSYILTGVDRRNGKVFIGGERISVPHNMVKEEL